MSTPTGRGPIERDGDIAEIIAHIKMCCRRLLLDKKLPREAVFRLRYLAWRNLEDRIRLAIPIPAELFAFDTWDECGGSDLSAIINNACIEALGMYDECGGSVLFAIIDQACIDALKPLPSQRPPGPK